MRAIILGLGLAVLCLPNVEGRPSSSPDVERVHCPNDMIRFVDEAVSTADPSFGSCRIRNRRRGRPYLVAEVQGVRMWASRKSVFALLREDAAREVPALSAERAILEASRGPYQVELRSQGLQWREMLTVLALRGDLAFSLSSSQVRPSVYLQGPTPLWFNPRVPCDTTHVYQLQVDGLDLWELRLCTAFPD